MQKPPNKLLIYGMYVAAWCGWGGVFEYGFLQPRWHPLGIILGCGMGLFFAGEHYKTAMRQHAKDEVFVEMDGFTALGFVGVVLGVAALLVRELRF